MLLPLILNLESTGTYADSNAFSITVTASAASSGGWWPLYDQEIARRKRRKKELEELEAERERIEDAQTREIAAFLQEQEAKDARRDELQRLADLVASYAQTEAPSDLSPRVQKAIAKAAERQTTWALQALERELKRAQEEEAFLLEALRIALDD